MLKQKFRRGNLVYIKKGSCQFNFEQDCNAVILGSYDDFYGGGDIFKYTVMLEDGRTVAWYNDEQLELVDDGGEYSIGDRKENKIRREAKRILEEENLEDLCDCDIVTLLRFIGFDYSVSNDYFRLWDEVYPLFMEIKKVEAPDELKEEYPDYDVEGVWKLMSIK